MGSLFSLRPFNRMVETTSFATIKFSVPASLHTVPWNFQWWVFCFSRKIFSPPSESFGHSDEKSKINFGTIFLITFCEMHGRKTLIFWLYLHLGSGLRCSKYRSVKFWLFVYVFIKMLSGDFKYTVIEVNRLFQYFENASDGRHVCTWSVAAFKVNLWMLTTLST